MQNRYIAVAASMTGGNSLATFIRMIQQWVIQLGVSVPQVGTPTFRFTPTCTYSVISLKVF